MFITIGFVYILIGIIEIYPKYKEKKYKEFWTYSVLMGLGALTSVLINLGVEIPSPSGPIENLIKLIL